MRRRQDPGLAATLLLALVLAGACVSQAQTGDPRAKLPEPEGAESVRALTQQRQHAAAEQAAREILARVEAADDDRSLQASKALDLLVETLWYAGQAGSPETLQLAERSLAIKQRLLEREHIETASSLYKLAALLRHRGRFADARPLFEQRLAIIKAILPPDDPLVAKSATDVANLLTTLGEYESAKPLYEQALTVMQAAAGPDHPDLAPHLYNLGRIHRLLGDFGEARIHQERALKSREASIGPDHVGLTPYLNGLANLLYQTGDYAGARRNYERALAIRRESLGPDHLDVAGSLNNLAIVFRHMGDYESARELFEQALKIREKKLDPEHALIAQSLHNLAVVLAKLGERERAVERFERAFKIQLEAYGTEHAAVATTLTNHADLLVEAGDYDGARARYERALAIRQKVFEPGHPDLASCLDGLGIVLHRIGSHEEAQEQFARALQIRENSLGPTHPHVAEVLDHYAALLSHLGENAQALELGLRAESVSRDHLMLTARTLPERQALRYGEHRAGGLNLVLSIAAEAGDPEVTKKAWDALIRSRALVLDEMAARSRSVNREADPEVAPYADELAQASRELAGLTLLGLEGGNVGDFRERLDRARSSKERAERALAERSVAFREEMDSRQVGLGDVRAVLPKDSALVAYAQYGSPPSYLALVLRADHGPALVGLGGAKRIDRLVNDWRTEAATGVMTRRTAEAIDNAYRASGGELRKAVWDPPAKYFEGVKQVFVVPDGALQLVSFAALPVGKEKYLVESGPLLHYLSAERDMAAHATARPHGTGLLAFGGPDFGDAAVMRFGELPATVREATEIAKMFPGDALCLTGAEASEPAFKARSPGRRILHLATHGFFLDGSRRSAPARTRAVGGLSSGPSAPHDENPLVLSGLALAGANHPNEAGPAGEDGILTAEEISAMDLSSVEWAVLSACDTGIGTIQAGEGIFGLRRAFQVAGVSTLIMSLWQVEDESTRRWMRALYESRLRQGRSTAEAVRHASLTMLRQRRKADAGIHPFYWAGFVAAGDWH